MGAGTTARSATAFLKAFYQDVHYMLDSWERQLGERGWHPRKSTQASSLSSGIYLPEKWLLRWIFRSYTSKETPKDALLLEILFDLEGAQEVQVMAARARYDKPANNDHIWNGWVNGLGFIQALGPGTRPVEVDRDHFQEKALPGAARAWGFLLPIDALVDETAVRDRLIQPLLDIPPEP